MKNKGFTLVELSIVLVIVGLLISGLLVGQSMIKTVKVQRFVRETEQYIIVFNNFKQKYQQLPGDSTYFSNPGDNDNIVEYPGGGVAGEWTRAWLHLSESQDLQESYTGAYISAAGAVPESASYDDLLFTIFDRNAAYGFNTTGHTMHLGGYPGGTWNAEPKIPPSSAAAFDVKVDDGIADTGILRVFANPTYNSNCLKNTAGNPYTAADWQVEDQTGLCTLLYNVNDRLY